MKEFSTSIQLGEGLGQIKFGMSRDQVKKLVGEPDEIEEYEHSEIDDKRAEAWHYDDPELSLAFEEFNNWKLTSIAISSPEFTLENNRLFDLNYDDSLKLLQKLAIGKVEEEDIADEDTPDIRLISIEDAGLNLWFEGDSLTEIQFSQIWMDDDEE